MNNNSSGCKEGGDKMEDDDASNSNLNSKNANVNIDESNNNSLIPTTYSYCNKRKEFVSRNEQNEPIQ